MDEKMGEGILEDSKQIKELLSYLKSDQSRIKGLKGLTDLLRCEESVKVAEYFLTVSKDCSEVFNILENGSKLPATELKMIWEILESILLTASEITTLHGSAILIVQRLLHNHIKLFYIALSESSPRALVNATFKLLASMMTQGNTAVKECISFFNFSLKSLMGINRQKPGKDGLDIRETFIKWFLSLIIFGDLSSLRQVLGIKVFVAGVMKCLPMISSATVVLVLSTLHSKVVKENRLLKKSKIEFFNGFTLSELSKLCLYGRMDHETHNEIRMLAYQILHDLCCDEDVGIGFPRKEKHLSRRSNNPVLLRFLVSVRQRVMEEEPLFQLTISTLSKYPDIILPYVGTLTMVTEPRQSTQWIQHINFLQKMWASLPNMAAIFGSSSEDVVDWNLVSSFILPDCLDRSILTHGLKHSSLMVKLVTAKMVAVIADRAAQTKLLGLKFGSSLPGSIDTQLVHVLPESSHLVAIRQILACGKSKKEENKEERGNNLTENERRSEHVARDVCDKALLAALRALQSYAKIWPTVFIDSGYNACKLMVFDDYKAFLENNELQEATLQLLLSVAPRTVKWNAKKQSYHCDLLEKVTDLYSSPSIDVEVKELALKVVMKLMNESGLFAGRRGEVLLWLVEAKRLREIYSDTIIRSFAKMCVEACQDQLALPSEVKDSLVIAFDDDENGELDDEALPSPLVRVAMRKFVQIICSKDEEERGVLNYICSVFCTLMMCSPSKSSLGSDILRSISETLNSTKQECSFQEVYSVASVCLNWLKANVSKTKTDYLRELGEKRKVTIPGKWKAVEFSRCVRTLLLAFPVTKKSVLGLLDDRSILASIELDSSCSEITELECCALTKCTCHLLGLASVCEGSIKQQVLDLALHFLELFHDFISNLVKNSGALHGMFDNLGQFYRTVFAEERIKGVLMENSKIGELIRGLFHTFLGFTADLLKDPLTQELLHEMAVWISECLKDWSADSSSALACYQLFEPFLDPVLNEDIVDTLMSSVESSTINVVIDQRVSAVMKFLLDRFLVTKQTAEVIFGEKNSVMRVKQLFKLYSTQLIEENPDFLNSLVSFHQSGLFRFLSPSALDCITKDVAKHLSLLLRLLGASASHRARFALQFGRQKWIDVLPVEHMCQIMRSLFLAPDCHVYKETLRMALFSSGEDNVLDWLVAKLEENPESREILTTLEVIFRTYPFEEKFPEIVGRLISKESKTIKYYRLVLPILYVLFETINVSGSNKLLKRCLVFVVNAWRISVQSNARHANIAEALSEKCIHKLLEVKGIASVISGSLANLITSMEKCIKTVLGQRIRSHSSMDCLQELFLFLSASEEYEKGTKVTPVFVYQLILGHSRFLDIVQGNEISEEARGSVFKFMLSIAKQKADLCSGTHIPFFLASYRATLSVTDQTIIQLLQLYEENEAFPETRLLIFGPAALDYYGYQKGAVKNLMSDPNFQEILELFDAKQMLESATRFPMARQLGDKDVVQNESEVYDPAFLLPLFSNLLDPSMEVDCRKFSYECCLGYVIGALSSKVPQVRVLATQILAKYSHQLEGSRFKEKNQVELLLKHLKFCLREKNQRMTSSLCNWFIQTLQLMLRPEQHLYPMFNGFLLSHFTIDPRDVPLFFPLFNSSTLKFPTERAWILRLIASSVRDPSDYYTLKRQHIFPLLMSFHDSPFSDNVTRKLVLDTLTSASKIHPAAFDLVKDFGLISWLCAELTSASHDKQVGLAIFEVCANLIQVFDLEGSGSVVYPLNLLFEFYVLLVELSKSDWVKESASYSQRLLRFMAIITESLTRKGEETTLMTRDEFSSLTSLFLICCGRRPQDQGNLPMEDFVLGLLTDSTLNTIASHVEDFLQVIGYFLHGVIVQHVHLSFLTGHLQNSDEKPTALDCSSDQAHEVVVPSETPDKVYQVMRIFPGISAIAGRYLGSSSMIEAFTRILRHWHQVFQLERLILSDGSIRLFLSSLIDLLDICQRTSRFDGSNMLGSKEDWEGISENCSELNLFSLQCLLLRTIYDVFVYVSFLGNDVNGALRTVKGLFASEAYRCPRDALSITSLTTADENCQNGVNARTGSTLGSLLSLLEDLLVAESKPTRYLASERLLSVKRKSECSDDAGEVPTGRKRKLPRKKICKTKGRKLVKT